MRDDAPAQLGTTVRGYRIERLIGVGGAAEVYEARRLGPRGPAERVACKVLHVAKRSEPEHREQARQEAVLGLRITAGHPRLVEILDFFDDVEARHCIVMELVDGASVAELRGPDRRLPFPVIRRVAVEVLEVLVYLHGRGVLHRDLSPRNILVTAGGAVKIADLGIARMMEQGAVHTQTVRGTPMYVPREAIELLPLDARADLFSLGAILYELVTGKPPCGRPKLMAKMFARNVAGHFAPLPPETPADLAQLITGLLPPERDAREPQTSAEALALLRAHELPMASAEELAGMVVPAQAQRDRQLEKERPESVLPPGYVLVPRDAQEAAEALAERMAGRGAGARLMAGYAADAVPDHVSDPLPAGMAERLPERVIDAVVERVADAAPERVTDAAPERVTDAAPERVTGAVPGRVTASIAGRAGEGTSRGRPGDAWRNVASGVAIAAAIVTGILVPAVLLDDPFRGEQAAVTPGPPAEIPASIVVPTPAPPVVPVVVAPVPEQESPRRATADGPHRQRTEAHGHDRNAEPPRAALALGTAPEQAASMGAAMRPGVMMAILVVMSLPGLLRAQSGADTAPVILLHSGVATVFQLPDAIVDARVHDRGEIRLAVIGDELFVRPRPGTPAGMKAPLEVKTRTARWTFQLVVVARARDAREDVQVEAVDVQAPEKSPPEISPGVPAERPAPQALPVGPMVPPLAVTPEAAEPTASAPTSEASPVAPTDVESVEPSSESNAVNMERDTRSAERSRFDLAAHVGAGLGFTGAKVAGYRAERGLRPHYSLDLRLTGEPRNTSWALQADVSGEWPDGSMVYRSSAARLEVDGPRLRLELGARASLGTTWKASLYAGGGILVHLRRTEERAGTLQTSATMEQAAVLAWGLGLRYRRHGRILLGLDFLVRQGGLEDYHSVEALLTVGRFLDQGD